MTRCILVASIACLAAACGNNNNSNNTTTPDPIVTNNKNNTSGNNTSANNTAVNNTAVNNTAVNNTAVNNTSNNTAPNANNTGNNVSSAVGACEDMGTVDASATPMIIDGSTTDASLESVLQTPCGFGNAPERSYLFTFDKPTRVTAAVTNGSTSWVIDVRNGTCEATASLTCDASPSRTFVVPAGETRLITVEPENNSRGTFELTLEFEELVCLPIGSTTCSGADISRCEQGGLAETVYTCGEACSMDSCGGDFCENAVEVSSFPYRFEGKTNAYGDRLDFDDATECYYPDGEGEDGMGMGMPFTTVGEDVTFKLTGLTAGQLLTVDARPSIGNQGDSAIFVMDTCDKSTCHIGRDLGDTLTDWEVPADGDYIVVVERRTLSTADIVVEIDVQ